MLSTHFPTGTVFTANSAASPHSWGNVTPATGAFGTTFHPAELWQPCQLPTGTDTTFRSSAAAYCRPTFATGIAGSPPPPRWRPRLTSSNGRPTGRRIGEEHVIADEIGAPAARPRSVTRAAPPLCHRYKAESEGHPYKIKTTRYRGFVGLRHRGSQTLPKRPHTQT